MATASGSAAQVYVEREGVTPDGRRTVQALKSTTVKTDSGLILTKHEYVEVERGRRTRPPPLLSQSRPINAGSVAYGTYRERTSTVQGRADGDEPTCLVCCALLMAFLSFGSILCGIPAALLACVALCNFSDDPEASRANAKSSICCSIFGIVVLIIVVVVVVTQK